jgi:FkbM family methyltransferase
MAADDRWESGFALRQWPLTGGAFLRCLLRVTPLDHRREYYRALGGAVASSLRERKIVPVERSLTGEVWVRYRGFDYLLTRETSFGYFLHSFEPRTAADLTRRSGDVFLDVGANTGQYAVSAARRFRTVVAVEPNPVAAEILRRNLARNHLANVRVVERLVLASRGTGRLFSGDVLTTWGTVIPSGRHVDVEAVTLDDLISEHDHVDLIKLDIEGREAEALLSSRLLARVQAISFSGSDDDLEKVRPVLEQAGFAVRTTEPVFRSVENFRAERDPRARGPSRPTSGPHPAG